MAVIKAVRIAAAHEGVAEMIVTLRYRNGGETEMPLDEAAVNHLFIACNASHADDLIGRDWRLVRDAIAASYNRYR